MAERFDADVVVAGGGIAGSMVAAALCDTGQRVIVLEPGLHSGRRLSGELLQPLGVAGLAELGLLDAITARGGVEIAGFHVWDECAGDVRLDYDRTRGLKGFAAEHADWRSALAQAAAARPGVNLLLGTRATGIEQKEDGIIVRVTARKTVSHLRARVLIGADGALSRVRGMAGIASRQQQVSTISGLNVPVDALPDPAYGQLFLGSGPTALAYSTGDARARIMFDHLGKPPSAASELERIANERLPKGLREAARIAIAADALRVFATQLVIVDTPRRGRVILVGDAAGACHPLTASGMSACVADALSLRSAVLAHPDNLSSALAQHVAHRRRARLSRIMLATALHEVCTGSAPGHRFLRAGLIRYWNGASGQHQAMSLLAMTESRPHVLFTAMLRTALCGLAEAWEDNAGRIGNRWGTAVSISRLLARYAAILFGGMPYLAAPPALREAAYDTCHRSHGPRGLQLGSAAAAGRRGHASSGTTGIRSHQP